jgi:soluble lytic murein transglycosylase
VSRELGEAYGPGRLIRDPDYNIRLGAHYLGQQLVRFGNEPVLALAAYNAGPGRVTKWLELNGDPRGGDLYRLVDWIELIPFAETRNYVQRVLEGRAMYRIALGQPALSAARSAAREGPAAPRAKPAS